MSHSSTADMIGLLGWGPVNDICAMYYEQKYVYNATNIDTYMSHMHFTYYAHSDGLEWRKVWLAICSLWWEGSEVGWERGREVEG